MTPAEGTRVQLSNALALLLALLTCLYVPVFVAVDRAELAWVILPLAGAYVIVPELNRAARTRASRLLIVATLSASAALVPFGLGDLLGAHLLFITVIALPSALFELARWRLIAVATALPAALYVSLHALVPAPAIAGSLALNLTLGLTSALILMATILYFAAVNDGTERELEDAVQCLEAEMIERKRLAVESAEKSRFLANMSHELRTPLNAIIGYSELIREGAPGRTVAEVEVDLQRIKDAGEHLLQLISEILDHSRIAAGKTELRIARFEVQDVVTRALVHARTRCELKGLELCVDIASDVSTMTSDASKLQRVLESLLSNAVKFTARGVVRVEVTAEHDHAGEWLSFAVSDTGIGISETTERSIFEPFKQGDMSFTREYGGTGLGLAISKSFTEMLGGSIALESEKGAGSRFTVRVPRVVGSALARSA